jgi:hypothetical protein
METSIQSKLYYNGWEVVETTSFFLYMIIGGRGIGKTYSILKGLLESDSKFMYVRRTDVEMKNCCKEVNNPFLTLNEDLGRNVEMKKNEDSYVIIEEENILGLGGSLSTFGKFRGSDFSMIDYIIFDEFISTTPYSKIKDEADLFFNMIETVMRNREINGKKPIKIIMLSNSNSLDNGIIKELKLGEIIRQMKINKEQEYIDTNRNIYLCLPSGLGITEKKKETALYKLTKGTSFFEMSLNNEFTSDNFDDVKKIPVNMLIPLFSYENITFYEVKNKDYIYCSYRKADCIKYTKENVNMLKKDYGMLLFYHIESKLIRYFNYDVKLEVLSIF